MKFPNHIVVDVAKTSLKSIKNYWIFLYLPSCSDSFFFNENVKSYKRFYEKKFQINWYFCDEKELPFAYSLSSKTFLLTKKVQKFYKNLFKSRNKVTNKLTFSKHSGKAIHESLNFSYFYKFRLIKILIVQTLKNANKVVVKNSKLWRLFDINFLKKEPIYTKLKYSRTPQYDMVSGGAAALFAGFLGFLICEKFGFELLDSGDFYFIFMYLVFFFFFLKLLLKHVSLTSSFWNVISYKWFYYFYKTLVTLFFHRFVK